MTLSVSETVGSNSCQTHNLFRDTVLNGSPRLTRRDFGSVSLAGFIPFLESEILEIVASVMTMCITLYSF